MIGKFFRALAVLHTSPAARDRATTAPPPSERFREIQFRDLGHYKRILRGSFSSGPGQEQTVEALLKAANLYGLFFFALKPLGRLGVLPAVIPRIFVCEQDARAVAAICTRRPGGADGPLYLVHLAVDEAYRRRGIATRLLGYVEETLLGQTTQLILTRALEDNEPQIRNRLKAGFTEYARQTRFTFRPADAPEPGVEQGEEGDQGAAATDDYEFCLPRPDQMAELRRREAPATAREIASAARERRPSRSLHSHFPLHRKWRAGYCRQGRLVAGAVLYYHRLQHTYELDLAVVPGVEDLADRLLRQAQSHIRGAGPVLHVTAHAYESAVTAVLTSHGFTLDETRILLCKHR